ncbi:uncharacterized protein K02A2.6-like [Uranotaenia lowii]|uniref:uncharacterized protein K02A2.6-like n=1 Tax=Uranotaenia lowii TaxID=190385 RepID=UPI0024798F57|nr:uncharacterized protein K02A2.6-like [Uranotaenia lowii]
MENNNLNSHSPLEFTNAGEALQSGPQHHGGQNHPQQPIFGHHGQQQQPRSIPSDPYLAQFFQQQQAYTNQMLQQQQQFIQQQLTQFRDALLAINVQVPSNPEIILDSLANNVKEFRFDPESNITFATWYGRYDDLFEKDAARLDDPAKVRLLMRKLGAAEHERYVSFILPRQPKDFTFTETLDKLKVIFGSTESVLNRRYRCLRLEKQPNEDYTSYACRINKSCVEFELQKLSEEEFKCLMFVCGLKAEKNSEVRTRLLCKIEDRRDVTLEQLSDDCQRLLSLKRDTAMIKATPPAAVQQLKRHHHHHRNNNKHPAAKVNSSNKNLPSTPCWLCGAMHYVRDCSFKGHKCSTCGNTGHREGYCSTARQNRKFSSRNNKPHRVYTKTVSVLVNKLHNSRRFVQAKLDGIDVRLQLDTGSDISVISLKTWERMGKLPGTRSFRSAESASGDHLRLLFRFDCDAIIHDEKRRAQFHVVDSPLHLLGIDMMNVFQLWSIPIDTYCNLITRCCDSVESLKATFPAVFQERLGLCNKTQIHLHLKPDAVPVFRPKRPVAYAIYNTVDDELDRLERIGIISPVDYSDWAAPIVVVRKSNGTIRICGDYSTGLNTAL